MHFKKHIDFDMFVMTLYCGFYGDVMSILRVSLLLLFTHPASFCSSAGFTFSFPGELHSQTASFMAFLCIFPSPSWMNGRFPGLVLVIGF